MAQNLVVAAPEPLIGGHSHDEQAALADRRARGTKSGDVVVDVLDHVEQQDDLGPARGHAEIVREVTDADVEARGASGGGEVLVGVHADRLAELAERREHVAAAAAELEQAHAACRQRAPQARADDGQPAAKPPVRPVLFDVDGDVGGVHHPRRRDPARKRRRRSPYASRMCSIIPGTCSNCFPQCGRAPGSFIHSRAISAEKSRHPGVPASLRISI